MRGVDAKFGLIASISAMALACGVATQTASAATCDWVGGNDAWSSVAKWSCGSVPGGADIVRILTPGSIVAISNISAFAGTLAIGGGNAVSLANSTLTIQNHSLAVDGILTVANGSNLISNNGAVALTGTGFLVLDDINSYARIYAGRFDIASGFTLRGSGQFGLNQTLMTNAGLVSANVSGRTLSIDAAGGNGGVGPGNGVGSSNASGFYNTGVLQATGGGNLSLEGGLYENGPGGVIQALAGSTVTLGNDARILNGTLSSTGTGVINAHGVSQYLQGVTLAAGGHLDVDNNNLYLTASLANNGLITVGHNSNIISTGSTTISGSGVIALDDSGGYARIYGGAITFGSNQSVTGSGQLGLNQTLITNNNLFSVGNGGNLSIDASGGNGGVGVNNGVGANLSSGLFNNGIIEAINGSTISLEGGRYENAVGGNFRALGGSTLSLNNDARVVGGTLTTDATSVISLHNVSQYLENVTLSSGSRVNIDNNNLYLTTKLTNNGSITVQHSSNIINSGSLTIDGTGTIILDDSTGVARIYGGLINFGAGQTVQGSGQLGLNQTLLLINNVFSANAGTALSIDASGGNGGVGAGNGVGTNSNSGLFNTSTIQATGGSTLSFEGGLYENSATGIIQALNGSAVNLNNDARILGGTLATSGTGVINAHNVSQYLQGVRLATGGHLDVDNDSLYLIGSFVNDGLVTVGHNANVIGSGNLTISGSGIIALDNSNGVARIYGGAITFGSNQSVTGSGQLGLNQTLITNNNLFSVDNGGNLSIDVSGGNGGVGAGNGVGANQSSGMFNNGIVEAINGSTVSLEGGRYENAGGGIFRALGGSTIAINGDARIVGGTLTTDATSVVNLHNVSQFLENVSVSSGSKVSVDNDNVYVNGSLTNNGTITIAHNASMIGETPVTIGGTGVIRLDDSSGLARIYSNRFTIGSGATIAGSGQLGVNQTYFVNGGTVSADVAGRSISVDVAGGSGGVGAGNGVGPDTASGMFNTGMLRAIDGGNLSFEGGRYANDSSGTLGAFGAGSFLSMNSDANLTNLQSGNIISLGHYVSSTNGAASTVNLRSNSTGSIATIGTANGATDTVITLSGINSLLNVINANNGVSTSIDNSLTTIASSGRLELLGNRSMTITAGGGAFLNAGVLQLGGGTFGAGSFANSGLATGFGTIALAVTNSGTVEASGGILATRAITGTGGTIRSLSGATLDMSAATGNSTAGFLTNNGALDIGTRTITVSNDYQNAGFGPGNAFNAHANVAGSGLLLASSATMDLSGPALSGNVLNVGNVRTGGSSSTVLTITNNGTQTTLRGAVQNSNAPSVQLTGADWAIGPNGGHTDVTISYTGTQAGSLSGQFLNVVNNFDNVADATVQIIGNVYQVAKSGNLPASIALAARRVGDAVASTFFNIANTAPVTPGFNEQLKADATVGGGFTLNGLGAVQALVDAGNSTPVTLALGTGTAGAFADSVTIANTSLAVPGSGLSDLSLASQSISVTGNVYAPAIASLSGNSVDLGVVRQGGAVSMQGLLFINSANGALTDQLITSIGSLPALVTATAPGGLSAGQSGQVVFTLGTTTAGTVSGTATLGFASHNAEMADAPLASKTIDLTGTVTELATASLFKNGGEGTLSGGGVIYNLDLGTLNADTGLHVFDLGILNGNSGQGFSELLGGSFAFSGPVSFDFSGAAFNGLFGGASDVGNLLKFDTSGLTSGQYAATLIFNGKSSYAGLSDLALNPITLQIKAQVQGNGNPPPPPPPPPVPEPASWAMMIFGLGLVGAMTRRRRVAVSFS